MKSLKKVMAAAKAAFVHVATDRHDERGFEKPDPIPVEMPLGFRRPEPLQEQIRRILRSERMHQLQRSRGQETLEDSMDFDTGEDLDDPLTPHEARVMQEEIVAEGALEDRRRKRNKPKDAPPAPPAAPAAPVATPPAPEAPKAP